MNHHLMLITVFKKSLLFIVFLYLEIGSLYMSHADLELPTMFGNNVSSGEL